MKTIIYLVVNNIHLFNFTNCLRSTNSNFFCGPIQNPTARQWNHFWYHSNAE